MPLQLSDLLETCDEQCENMVLSEILSTRRMVLDLDQSYFTASRMSLFMALSTQWERNGKIVPELLYADHSAAIDHALSCHAASGKEIIGRLHTCYLSRSQGLLMCEALRIDNPSEALAAMEGYIAEALYSHKSSNYDHNEEMQKLIAAIDKGNREKLSVVGFSTGISSYDKLTNGLERGKMYVVGALKKTGKSRWMVHTAINACKSGAGVIIDSLEMSPTRLNQLALSYFSSVNSAKIGRVMTMREMEALSTGYAPMRALPWKIYRDHTIAALRSRVIYERTKSAVDVVFIDFIQRLRDDSFKGDRTREVERISQDAADMARSLDVALVMLTQLKGEAEHVGAKGQRQQSTNEEDEMPNMSHVKESQGIAENADVITILHNPKRHDNPFAADGSYMIPVMLCKVEQRDDISGNIIKLRADLRTCQFSEADGFVG